MESWSHEPQSQPFLDPWEDAPEAVPAAERTLPAEAPGESPSSPVEAPAIERSMAFGTGHYSLLTTHLSRFVAATGASEAQLTDWHGPPKSNPIVEEFKRHNPTAAQQLCDTLDRVAPQVQALKRYFEKLSRNPGSVTTGQTMAARFLRWNDTEEQRAIAAPRELYQLLQRVDAYAAEFALGRTQKKTLSTSMKAYFGGLAGPSDPAAAV